jgi:hypothetical protein
MDEYICSECQNDGVKLWRKYNSSYGIVPLFCFDCISKKVPNIKIDEKAMVFIDGSNVPGKFPCIISGRIFIGSADGNYSYSLVPAVPINFELNNLKFFSFMQLYHCKEYLQWLELPNKLCIFNFPEKLLN